MKPSLQERPPAERGGCPNQKYFRADWGRRRISIPESTEPVAEQPLQQVAWWREDKEDLEAVAGWADPPRDRPNREPSTRARKDFAPGQTRTSACRPKTPDRGAGDDGLPAT